MPHEYDTNGIPIKIPFFGIMSSIHKKIQSVDDEEEKKGKVKHLYVN